MVAYLEHFTQREGKHFCFRKLWEMFLYLSAALDIFRMALTVQCMEAEGKISIYLCISGIFWCREAQLIGHLKATPKAMWANVSLRHSATNCFSIDRSE